MRWWAAFALLILAACQSPEPIVLEPEDRPPFSGESDVAAACEIVRTNYAYVDRLSESFDGVCEIAEVWAEANGNSVEALEIVIASMDDNHTSLNVNTQSSPRLIPTGTDMFLEEVDGRFVVAAVRPGSGAAEALFLPDPNVYVVGVNGYPVEEFKGGVGELNRAIAGRRDVPRSVSIIDPLMARRAQDDPVMVIDIGEPEPPGSSQPVTAQRLDGNIAYVRFNNSLDDSATVTAFDAAAADLRDATGWVIDLRDTPGGGNTGVAEPILGRFITEKKAYQLTVYPGKAPQTRFAEPRGPWTIEAPVVVIVGRWTGSMGEGMAIGFDGMGVATVIGTEMARLRGGVEGFELPSGYSLRLPTYDLRHVNGTPRHEWVPPVFVTADNGNGPDLALGKALDILRGEGD